PSQAFFRHHERACLISLNTAALTSSRWRKPECPLLVRSKTAVSISTTTTPPLIRWTKSSRKNWRKILLSSQSLRMRLRTSSNRCLVELNVDVALCFLDRLVRDRTISATLSGAGGNGKDTKD